MARPAQLTQAILGMIKGGFFQKNPNVKPSIDGAVSLMQGKDGKQYIIQVARAEDSKLKGLFKKELGKRK